MLKPQQYTPKQKRTWWGEGPWVNEPDYVEFEHNGLKCRIIRTVAVGFESTALGINIPPFGGYLCGYVQLPLNYHLDELDIDADIHGSITYNQKEDDGHYWVGFDCAHAWDTIPSMIKRKNELRKDFKMSHFEMESYKDFVFVEKECKSLADQVKGVQNANP